jgi:CHAD domain-containing protein
MMHLIFAARFISWTVYFTIEFYLDWRRMTDMTCGILRRPMLSNFRTVELPFTLAPAARPARSRAGAAARGRGRVRLGARLLRQRSDVLFHHFPAALAGDEEAIHQLRVAGRRMRVALWLLADKPEGKRARRAQFLLRDLARTAGLGRDLDVLLAIYREHLDALEESTPEQRRLRHRLGDGRRRGRLRMVGKLLDLEIPRLRRDLSVLIARAVPSPPVVVDRFRALQDREGKLLIQGFNKLGAILDIAALHALRRRARRLRYAVEIWGEIALIEPGATKPWKCLQDRIGVLHDHHVLAEWLARQAEADARKGRLAVASAARAEAEWAREAMHKLHDELLSAAPVALVQQGLALVGSPSSVIH